MTTPISSLDSSANLGIQIQAQAQAQAQAQLEARIEVQLEAQIQASDTGSARGSGSVQELGGRYRIKQSYDSCCKQAPCKISDSKVRMMSRQRH